jgi:hypothetical protein
MKSPEDRRKVCLPLLPPAIIIVVIINFDLFLEGDTIPFIPFKKSHIMSYLFFFLSSIIIERSVTKPVNL